MVVSVSKDGKEYKVDLTEGIDISTPLIHGSDGPNCFYAPFFEASPLIAGNFIGDTLKGSPVNFYNVRLNPHGNGTHTECVGHISTERISINDVLKVCHYFANVISIYPQKMKNGDKVITQGQIAENLESITFSDVLIVRTMPNDDDKLTRSYSGTNPPYFEEAAIRYIIEKGYKHLVTDLPSIDKEEDEGKLSGHKAFWNYPNELNLVRTITELVYIPNNIKDGHYFVNFQIPPFQLDAASSRIFLFLLKE